MNLASCFRGCGRGGYSSAASTNHRHHQPQSLSATAAAENDNDSGGRKGQERRKKISSTDSGRTLFLTAEEIKCIQRSWYSHRTGSNTRDSVAVRIFFGVFQTKPEMAALFGLDPKKFSAESSGESAAVEEEYLLTHGGPFLGHAKAFASFFDLIIEELSDDSNNPDDLISIIRSMGTHHSTIPNLLFTAENFLLIKSKILETVCGGNQKFSPAQSNQHCQSSASPSTTTTMPLLLLKMDKRSRAWCKLLMFIIAEMKDAYLRGVNRKNTWPANGRKTLVCPMLLTKGIEQQDGTKVSTIHSSSSGYSSEASSSEDKWLQIPAAKHSRLPRNHSSGIF